MAVTPAVGGAGAVVGSYGVSGAAGLSVGPGVGGRESSAAGSDTGPAGPGVVARSDPVGGPLGALVLVLVLGSDDGDGAADAADAVGPIGVSRLVGRSAGDRAWGSTAPGRGSVTAEVRHGAKLPLTPPPWEVRHARLGRGRAPRGRLSHSAVSAAGPWTWDNGGPDQHLRSRGWAESSTSRHPLSCGPRSSRTRGPPRLLVDPSPMSASPGNRPHLLGRAGGWHGPFRRRGAFRPPASPGHRGGGSGWALAMPR